VSVAIVVIGERKRGRREEEEGSSWSSNWKTLPLRLLWARGQDMSPLLKIYPLSHTIGAGLCLLLDLFGTQINRTTSTSKQNLYIHVYL
jgi:hypothetical protein